MNKRNHKGKSSFSGHSLSVGLLAFVMAVPASLASQALVGNMAFLPLALLLLLVVIFTGVFFDVVGVAAMAADEAPLHAMAAHGVYGARQAVRLVKKAHRVASVCNDVVGDVTGALSGAIGVSILFHMVRMRTAREELLATSLMTAAVAALIVTGKAYAKGYAMRRCTSVMLRAGQALALGGRVLRINSSPTPANSRGHAARDGRRSRNP